MAKFNVRVEIPSDPSALIALAAEIQAKDTALGKTSPLGDLEDAQSFGPAVARAAEHDGKADDYEAKREIEIGERNKDVPAVTAGVRTRRDLLLEIYRSNPKKLAEWGFDVTEGGAGSSGASGTPPPAPAPGK